MHGLLGNILPFEQIHIIDNGCERRFNIMGDIRDQVRLHPLTADTFIHGPIQALADIIDIIGKLQKHTGTHILCLNLIIQIPIGNLLRAPGNILDCHKLPPNI